jgi:hypothetical protein
MNEWDNTPLSADKAQLRQWFENKIRAYAHQARVFDEKVRREEAVERLLSVVVTMSEEQVVPSVDVFEIIGGQGPPENPTALVFAANSHFLEIHKRDTGGPFSSAQLQPIYVVGERLFDKAREVVKVLVSQGERR